MLLLEARLEVTVALFDGAGVRAAVRVLEVLLAEVVDPHELREGDLALRALPPKPTEQASLLRRLDALSCCRVHLALLPPRGWAALRR
jgi:hypothetical protein